MSFTIGDVSKNIAIVAVAYQLGSIFAPTDRATLASYVLTFAVGIFFLPLTKQLLFRGSQSARDSGIYNLNHGRLNLEWPPSMWMNMGYWKNTDDFRTACRDLLEEVIETAGLLDPVDGCNDPPASNRSFALLDLGFGCGDQTLHLYRHLSKIILPDEPEHRRAKKVKERPLFDHYVGITLDRKQKIFAEHRLNELGVLNKDSLDQHVKLFCTNAADPSAWDESVQSAVKGLNAPRMDNRRQRHTWVLALDTLYHFFPSRWPIIQYARKELDASIMAFDLMLAEDVSQLNRILLTVLTALMGTPFQNFVTKAEYQAELIQVGYAHDDIVIRDISEHVFAPLVSFLDRRGRDLEMIGFGLGAFHVAKWMFGWWAKTGAVRGCIVIARKGPS